MVAIPLAVGMAGYYFFEDLDVLDSFVNTSMILSGVGPLHDPTSVAGKRFAGIYALYPGFAVLVIAAITFAPFIHRVLHKFHLETEDADHRAAPASASRPAAQALRAQATPSSSSSRPSLWALRNALGLAYSDESHHFFAASTEGNSITTRRRSGHSPSSVSALPPRTRNRPPYCSIVAGTVVV
jgi:hypothetical protein